MLGFTIVYIRKVFKCEREISKIFLPKIFADVKKFS